MSLAWHSYQTETQRQKVQGIGIYIPRVRTSSYKVAKRSYHLLRDSSRAGITRGISSVYSLCVVIMRTFFLSTKDVVQGIIFSMPGLQAPRRRRNPDCLSDGAAMASSPGIHQIVEEMCLMFWEPQQTLSTKWKTKEIEIRVLMVQPSLRRPCHLRFNNLRWHGSSSYAGHIKLIKLCVILGEIEKKNLAQSKVSRLGL